MTSSKRGQEHIRELPWLCHVCAVLKKFAYHIAVPKEKCCLKRAPKVATMRVESSNIGCYKPWYLYVVVSGAWIDDF